MTRRRRFLTFCIVVILVVGGLLILEARDLAIRHRIEHTCLEDQACWDCTTMGNHVCGPINR